MRTSGLRQVLIFAPVLSGALAVGGTARAQVSVTYQIDPAHDGRLVTSTPFAPPLRKLWAVDLGGPISFPIVAQKLVIVTVNNVNASSSKLFALNAADGTTVWEKSITGTYSESYAAFDKGRVFDLNFDGLLEAYDAKTGAVLWTIKVPGQYAFESAPVANAGYIYIVGAGDGATFYKIDEKTGTVIWQAQGNEGYSLPAVTPGRMFVDAGCDIYALDIATGNQFWHDNGGCGGGASGNPAVHAKKLFAPYFGGGSGVILDSKTGALLGGYVNADGAFYGDMVLQNQQGALVGTEVSSGNIDWTFAPTDPVTLPPIIVNSTAYALSQGGQLYAVDPTTGTLVQTLSPGVGTNPGEGSAALPGLGAGQGILVVPSASLLTAFGP